jgi:enoyl-CoA hydratase
MTEFLTVDRRERVAVVTLDDPKRRNALSGGMVAEIVAAFDELEADDGVGAVIVTGAPPAFCAGADLGDLSKAGETELRAIYEGFIRVARSTLPTVAAVNGAAVGAGMNLALACDVRIAAHTARFDVRFLDLGIHPGGGHTWLLQRAIGAEAAAAMVLFGQVVDGRGAERTGLVWRSVEPDDLLDEAVVVAANAASNPKALVAAAKQTMADMIGIDTHPEAVERELTTQVWSVEQGWITERLAAGRVLKEGPAALHPL